MPVDDSLGIGPCDEAPPIHIPLAVPPATGGATSRLLNALSAPASCCDSCTSDCCSACSARRRCCTEARRDCASRAMAATRSRYKPSAPVLAAGGRTGGSEGALSAGRAPAALAAAARAACSAAFKSDGMSPATPPPRLVPDGPLALLRSSSMMLVLPAGFTGRSLRVGAAGLVDSASTDGPRAATGSGAAGAWWSLPTSAMVANLALPTADGSPPTAWRGSIEGASGAAMDERVAAAAAALRADPAARRAAVAEISEGVRRNGPATPFRGWEPCAALPAFSREEVAAAELRAQREGAAAARQRAKARGGAGGEP